MGKLEFTGERLVTDFYSYGTIEHLHRYSIAAKHLRNDMVVLDVACGEGYGTYMLSKCVKKAIGVDISNQAIEHAKNKYVADNLVFINSNALQIPLESNQFDTIISFETLEHLVEHDKLIEEYKRLLKSTGLLILSTPDKRFYSKDVPNPFHLKELDLEELDFLMSKYFAYTNYIYQKTVHASMIFNPNSGSIMNQYSGDFERIIYNPNVIGQEFVICFATNLKNQSLILGDSIFDGNKIYEEELKEYISLRNKYNNLVNNKKFVFINRVLKKLGMGIN